MFTRRPFSALVLAGCLLAPAAAHAQSDNTGDAALMTLAGDNGRTMNIHVSPSDLAFDVARTPESAKDVTPSALLVLIGSLIGSKDGFVEDRAFNDEVWSECPAVYKITTESAAVKKAFELARVTDVVWVLARTSQRYTLFLPDGTPTRATVQVEMKEASKPTTRPCKEPRR